MTTASVHVAQDPEPLDGFTLLYRVAEQIQRARHVADLYQDAIDGLRGVVGADRAALLLLDDGLMRFGAWSRLSERCRAGVEGFAPWRPDVRDPRPVCVDVATAAEVEAVREVLLEEGVRTVACVPLLHRGRLTGEILLLRDAEAGFTDAELRIAEAIAGQVAFAVSRSRSDADQAELLRRFEAERSVLKAVVHQMPAGVLLADVPSGRIIMANPQVVALWGAAAQQANRIADYGRWDGRTLTGRPLAPEDWPLARAVLHGTTVREEDIEVVSRDGERRIIRMSAAPVLDSQHRQLAAVATLYDVTRERHEEERHVMLADATRALNSSLDLASTLGALAELLVGRYADWSAIHRRAEPDRVQRVALAVADPAHSGALEAMIPEGMPLDAEHAIARVIREGSPLLAVLPVQARAALTVGGDVVVPAALSPTSILALPLGARDRVLGTLLLARTAGRYSDEEVALLTELATRAGLAMDNAVLYEQATSADRAKSNFLAVMSHEFRTPLSAILGYADILTEEVHGAVTAKQRGHLERVKASVRHLSHLVDEILSFASMEAGRERVRPHAVDVAAVVREVGGLMEPIAEAAGLDLRVAAPAAPVEITTDGSKLRQILINLVSNAIKYTPEGYVEFVLESGDGAIYCRVTDTGPGIAPDHVENVFEPFWQLEGGGGPRVSGTGLGLAVARRLARLLDGDVHLLTRVGEGSQFTLVLPRTSAAVVASTQES